MSRRAGGRAVPLRREAITAVVDTITVQPCPLQDFSSRQPTKRLVSAGQRQSKLRLIVFRRLFNAQPTQHFDSIGTCNRVNAKKLFTQ